MNVNLLDLLVLIGLSQGFVFGAVLLFSRFFRGTANRYLAYSIIMVSIIGINLWLTGWDLDEQYYAIDFFGDDVPWIMLFHVPMFVFFLKSTRHSLAESKKVYWLCLPFFVFLLLNIYIDLDLDFDLYEIPDLPKLQALVYNLEDYIALVLSIVLCLWSLRIIRRSSLSSDPKKWLMRIWSFVSILVICWMTFLLLADGTTTERPWLEYSLWIGISTFIYWLTYRGLYQLKLLKDQSAIQALLVQEAVSQQPVERSLGSPKNKGFTNENTYFRKLEHLMQTEYLYRNPDLGREVVADQLGISTGYLSQLINAVTSGGFVNFVNGYRIEDVKRMMNDPAFAQYSLLAIGLEAGFKSKSSFYATFKKEVGLTPSQYKKRQKEVLIS